MSCGLILIAAVDVPFQLWSSKQKLMMTKQEVRDEYKDSEGKPEVKQRIRQLQREMAERRMMQSVPDADVVITNPTHFAVALKYDPAKGSAPVLLATSCVSTRRARANVLARCRICPSRQIYAATSNAQPHCFGALAV